ncbi:MAG: hypothetical protein LBI27_05405 [Clostridiales bacterium]|jgi:hypothetical protein|nr:hypothetical protein [Clostridiales bacterium]
MKIRFVFMLFFLTACATVPAPESSSAQPVSAASPVTTAAVPPEIFEIPVNETSSVKSVYSGWEFDLLTRETENEFSFSVNGRQSWRENSEWEEVFRCGEIFQNVESFEWEAESIDIVVTLSDGEIFTYYYRQHDHEWLTSLEEAMQYRAEIRGSLRDDMPEYRFVLTGVYCHIYRMPTYMPLITPTVLYAFDENDEPILFMEFDHNDMESIYYYFYASDFILGIYLADVNFDGCRDIVISGNSGGTYAISWYPTWLWDAETETFVYSPSFSRIGNASIDWENQLIFSWNRSGIDYQYYDYYQFIDGEFINTNSLTFEWSPGNEIRIIEERQINGEWETVRHITASDEEADAHVSFYSNDEIWQFDHPRWGWHDNWTETAE